MVSVVMGLSFIMLMTLSCKITEEYFCFPTYKANNKKTIKEIVCRNLEKKEDAKKLVEDYNSRYSKVNHFEVNFVNSYSYNMKCVYEAQDAQVKFTFVLQSL